MCIRDRNYSASESFNIQAANEVVVFSTQALTSLIAGWLVFNYGWNVTNLLAIPLLVLALAMLARLFIFKSVQKNKRA